MVAGVCRGGLGMVSVEWFNVFMFPSVNPPALKGWEMQSLLRWLDQVQNLQLM